MGFLEKLFGKRATAPEWAPFFDDAACQDFLAEVSRQLASKSLPYEVDCAGGMARLATSNLKHTLALGNLAQRCNQAPQAEWPALIAGQINTLLNADQENEVIMPRLKGDFEAARALLKVRLYPQGDVVRQHGTYQEPMHDVAATLVYDLPERIAFVPRDHVEAWKRPVDELFALAKDNVKANDPVQVDQLELTDDTSLTLLSGDTHFAATHALFLEGYLPRPHEHGALLAVPHRHAVVAYPIVNKNVMVVINSMIQMADGMYKEGPGSVSPHLYWWREGEVVHLPSRVTNKEIEFSPPDDFSSVLTQFM